LMSGLGYKGERAEREKVRAEPVSAPVAEGEVVNPITEEEAALQTVTELEVYYTFTWAPRPRGNRGARPNRGPRPDGQPREGQPREGQPRGGQSGEGRPRGGAERRDGRPQGERRDRADQSRGERGDRPRGGTPQGKP